MEKYALGYFFEQTMADVQFTGAAEKKMAGKRLNP